MRMRPAFACLAATALATTAPVFAQSFVGVGPVRTFTLPTEPRGEPAPVPASVTQPPPPAEAEPPAPKADELRRLSNSASGFRFDGEWAQAQWPLYLTAADARLPAQFRLAFLSAISVMPEGSKLKLAINDRVVAETTLSTPDAIAERLFEIPAGLLVSGFNAVQITVEQRHRVDCSPAATYELWTALDRTRSGLVLRGENRRGPEQPADIAAVAPRADGAWPVRVLLTGKLTPESAGRAFKAAQIATLAGRSPHPAIEFVTAGRDEPGLELAIGTAEELQTRPELTDLGTIDGPRFGFLPARAGRTATFVVTGRDATELDTALTHWDAQRMAQAPIGSAAGLRLANATLGLPASGTAERVSFAEAGSGDIAFSGRMLRMRLDLALPADSLPADYDRVALALAGSHAAGLSRDANILVEVNGRTAATQTLAAKADALDKSRIFLPLSLMRPGQNRIELIARVPRSSDETCAGNTAQATRLTVLGSSEILLPRLARTGRVPELAMTAAGAYPFTRPQARPVLFVPAPDRASMAAAASFVARLAVAAGRPLDFGFAMTAPADGSDVLLVAPAPGLDPAWIRSAGLDPDRIRQSWEAPPVTARTNLSEAEMLTQRCALPSARSSSVKLQEEPPAAFTVMGLRASLTALPLWQPVDPPSARSEEQATTGATSLLVGQALRADGEHVWTLVTAADAATLQAGVQCLTHPALWPEMAGRITALASDETVTFVPAGEQQRLLATQPASLANWRLIAAAWLSLNPLAYVGAILLLVVALAATTLGLVLNTGRRQE